MTKETEKPLGDSTTKPPIKSWGIGEGRLPITTDPENPTKFFATYVDDVEEVNTKKSK